MARGPWNWPRVSATSPGVVLAAVIYVLIVSGVMIWRQVSVSPDYLILIFVPVAAVAGRFLGFLRDWVPFVLVFLGWEAIRGLAPALGIAPHVGDVAGAEMTLFGGAEPTAWLQSLATGSLGRVLAYAATVVYFCHFVIPMLTGLVLWLADRSAFRRYALSVLGMSFAAFIVFLLVPTAPPWYAEQQGVLQGVTKLISTTLGSSVSPYYNSLNPDPVAAFPSLHAAYPLLAFFALRQVFPRAAWLMLAWSVLVWISVVFLGEHYVVDVVGGIALAASSAWVARRVSQQHDVSLSGQTAAHPRAAVVVTGDAAPSLEPAG